MQYHLDTIPVWEAMEQQTPCPVCVLKRRAEQMELAYVLGESVMEPDARMRINRQGFCEKHDRMLLTRNNKLGHALLTDSHCKDLLPKLGRLAKQAEGAGGLRRLFSSGGDTPLEAIAKELRTHADSCVVCDALDTHMNRYLYTFMHLIKTDSKFEQAWNESQGACLPHTALLLEQAVKHLPANKQQPFAASAMRLLQQSMANEKADLEYFIQKFDYRNQDKPWGDSKASLERMLACLHGSPAEDKPGATK